MNRQSFDAAYNDLCALCDLLEIKPMHGAKLVAALQALKSAADAPDTDSALKTQPAASQAPSEAPVENS